MEVPSSHPHDLFSFPAATPSALSRELRERGRLLRLAAGGIYLHEQASVDSFALVRAGSLRVFKSSDSGREITLYDVGPGECCTVNVICLLAGRPSPATAVAESAVEAVVYPRALFLSWMAAHAAMRSFIFGVICDKFGDLMALVEEVAFRRIDVRLATYLAGRGEREGDALSTTHEMIARDLGTAREVVSRLLKTFEGRGLVALGRGRLEIRNRQGLQEYEA